MNTITIRLESNTDQKDIYDIHKLAFGKPNEANLVDALRKNKGVFIPELSLVAEHEGILVGHILFSKIFIEDHNEIKHSSLALAPMAVSPEWQGQGVGGMLIQKGIERAKDMGYYSVIVLGHEHYYPKFGFLPAEKWQIKAPFEVPSNVFFALELLDGGLDNVSGTVMYPDEFLDV